MKPQRIQLRRTKGWRMPPNTVKVARPTKWGNPFRVGQIARVWHRSAAHPHSLYLDTFRVVDASHAAALFARAMRGDPDWYPADWRPPGHVTALRGKNLACFCPLDQPCHADVLLEIANAP